MIKSLAFSAYPVSNLSRSRQFYEGVLGLKPASATGDHWQEYELGEGTFGIGVLPDGAPDFFKLRAGSVAFEVEDLDVALETLKQHDIPLLFGPSEYPGCRMAVIEDPDKNVLTLHQLKQK